MQIDDIVFIEINEGDWEDSKDIKTEEEIDSPLVFTIPRDILKGYSGQTIIFLVHPRVPPHLPVRLA